MSFQDKTLTCRDCGQQTPVPFQPSTGRPVCCSDCFIKQPGRSYR